MYVESVGHHSLFFKEGPLKKHEKKELSIKIPDACRYPLFMLKPVFNVIISLFGEKFGFECCFRFGQCVKVLQKYYERQGF